jgi:hypothetical protein
VNSRLVDIFIAAVPPASRVVDIGAGDGAYALEMATRGFVVRPVDVLEAPIRHPNITWEQRDIVEWLCSLHPADQFEGFFLRHVVQYYDSRWLRGILERLFDHASSNAVVAIETFADEPTPPFRDAIQIILDSCSFSWAECTLAGR